MQNPTNQTPQSGSTLIEILQTPISTAYYEVRIYVKPDTLEIPETKNVEPRTEKTSYQFSRPINMVRSTLHPALLSATQKFEIGKQTASETLDRISKLGYVEYVFRSLSREQLAGIKRSMESLQVGLNR